MSTVSPCLSAVHDPSELPTVLRGVAGMLEELAAELPPAQVTAGPAGVWLVLGDVMTSDTQRIAAVERVRQHLAATEPASRTVSSGGWIQYAGVVRLAGCPVRVAAVLVDETAAAIAAGVVGEQRNTEGGGR
jgi:hypothetical protein